MRKIQKVDYEALMEESEVNDRSSDGDDALRSSDSESDDALVFSAFTTVTPSATDTPQSHPTPSLSLEAITELHDTAVEAELSRRGADIPKDPRVGRRRLIAIVAQENKKKAKVKKGLHFDASKSSYEEVRACPP